MITSRRGKAFGQSIGKISKKLLPECSVPIDGGSRLDFSNIRLVNILIGRSFRGEMFAVPDLPEIDLTEFI